MNIFKINIPKQIILLLFLAIVLNIMRIVIFGSFSLIYILWNLFLALLPFLISSLLLQQAKKVKLSRIVFIIGGIFWLLLLPNAPYLFTDLIHIGVVHNVPALYDSVILFSSAWVGMLLGMYSLFQMEQIFKMKYSILKTNILIVIIIFLTSFGVYLGRFLRFNSWDIFVNHFSVLRSVWGILSQAAIHIEAYLYTILFFFFIYLSYNAWKYTQVKIPHI